MSAPKENKDGNDQPDQNENAQNKKPKQPVVSNQTDLWHYDGYDEQRGNSDYEYERDYDVDEDDANQRRDEYQEYNNKTGAGGK